ncbi:MAG: sigma 54-interacting transcriptional regulator [Bryobacterales bacterium]|nr:sigma 54-interacting transcriptional regulator [Bryobacterales bacterium]
MRLIAVSSAARSLLHVDGEEVEGRGLHELLPATGFLAAPQEGEWRLRLSARQMVEVRVLAVPNNGSSGWALYLREVPLTSPGVDFVGQSQVVSELLEFVSRIAASRATSILIQGESGTGKELIARLLHEQNPHASGDFVALNCAAVPDSLLESELFGHERGAFTDARLPKPGLFDLADRGTLFLDEIGEMPAAMQAKLLRVLEDQTFRRVGGVRDRRVELRVVAATNRNLEQAVAEGRFRSDLYFRLNVVQIRVPALRERVEDIRPLALHFVAQFNRKHGRRILGLAPDAVRRLEACAWPGNVRELRNAIERAVLLEDSSRIAAASLYLPPRQDPADPAAPAAPLSIQGSEKRLIEEALARAGGNQSRAAVLLGIGRFSLRYRMKKFGLL